LHKVVQEVKGTVSRDGLDFFFTCIATDTGRSQNRG
jgi:hypothetical protein